MMWFSCPISPSIYNILSITIAYYYQDIREFISIKTYAVLWREWGRGSLGIAIVSLSAQSRSVSYIFVASTPLFMSECVFIYRVRSLSKSNLLVFSLIVVKINHVAMKENYYFIWICNAYNGDQPKTNKKRNLLIFT